MQILSEESEESMRDQPVSVNRKFKLFYNDNIVLANCTKAEVVLGLNAENTKSFIKILPNVQDMCLNIKHC
jgi:hypothetical protein